MRTKMLSAAVVCMAAVVLAGCGSDSSVGTLPTNTAQLKLVVNTSTDVNDVKALTRINPLKEGLPDSVTITSGKFLVRSLQFKQTADYMVDTDISAADEARDQSDPNILYQGPYVLQASDNQALDLGSRTVPVGDYNTISLILHEGKATDDLGTATDMVGYSVKVTGYTWYGDVADYFTFTLNLKTEILVRGDFSVPAGGSPEYVVEFDVAKWFAFGNEWLNPNEAENLPRIYQNIQKYIQGGRDYDGDGSVGD